MIGLNLSLGIGSRLGGAAAYSQNRVAFDGATFRNLPAAYAASNSSGIVFSVWLDLSLMTNGVRYDFLVPTGGTGGGLLLRRTATNRINISFAVTDGALFPAETITSVGSFTSGVNHVLASWRIGAQTKQLVVNGTTDTNAAFTLGGGIEMAIAGDRTNHQLGGSGVNTFGWLGQVGDLYAAPADFDITDAAVQAKFSTAGGLPVDLGASGLTPTGAQPGIFFGADMTASTGGPSNTGWNGGVHHGSWGAFSS